MMSCRYGQIGMDSMNDTTEALTPVRFIVTIVVHSLGDINVASVPGTLSTPLATTATALATATGNLLVPSATAAASTASTASTAPSASAVRRVSTTADVQSRDALQPHPSSCHCFHRRRLGETLSQCPYVGVRNEVSSLPPHPFHVYFVVPEPRLVSLRHRVTGLCHCQSPFEPCSGIGIVMVRHLLEREVVHAVEEKLLRFSENKHSVPTETCPTSPTKSMDVLGGLRGRTDLEHPAHVWVVHPTRRHVRREEEAPAPLLELGRHFLARALGLPRVHLEHIEPDFVEQLGVVLGEGGRVEKHHPFEVGVAVHLCLQVVQEHRGLLAKRAHRELLRNVRVRIVLFPDSVHKLKVVRPHHRLCERLDVPRHGRRERDGLPGGLGRQLGHDLSDVVHEPHLEEHVGLVKHEDLQLGHLLREAVVLEQIEEPSRGRDHNVGQAVSLPQRGDILSDLLPAHRDERVPDEPGLVVERAELLELFLDLHRQLTGRRDDERRDLAAALIQRHRCQLLNHRHQERQRLAGPGLCFGQDVRPREARRQRLGLHLGGVLIPEHLGDRSFGVGVDRHLGEPQTGELCIRLGVGTAHD
eukprot:m.11011 g.11011  ORF g.11011 m.11011 type:complete len:586 (-) comp7216_c0_seq1:395-2152(-)